MTISGRNVMQQVWHRLVGVRGATNLFSDQISSSAKGTSNFGQVYYPQAAQEIAKHRLVFFGEVHSMPPIIAFQRQVQAAMVEHQTCSTHSDDAKVHVIMEHFSLDLQSLLDDYCNGKYTFEELVQHYREMGEEGHELEPYRDLLEDARLSQSVRLHAGFLPRKYARMLLKEGSAATLQAAAPWLPSIGSFQGTSFHYNIFESLLSGRFIYNNDDIPPTDQFRRIFDAQVLKDVAMAHKVNGLIEDNSDDKYLVIAGNGHLLHYCGVPERVLEEHPQLAKDSCLIISESTDASAFNESKIAASLTDRFGKEGYNPADYVYLYQIPQEILNEWQVKEETQKAYDQVGETAALQGNMLKAAWIMYNMGYTEEQFQIAGQDAYNFQGVGNPHLHAKIQKRDRVLDVGSGLGIDSFIACHATGPEGEVVGIDISTKEVKHAQKRAQERGFDNLKFHVADMERIPLPDDSVDVVISNGAFCLAPNKQKAFRELYRVLKPGGRISVCTTTTQVDNLEPGVSWPLCMKMFIRKKDIKPLCEDIGFVNVVIDDSDSSMTMEIPENVLQNDTNPRRNRVHVGGEDFKHLEDYDMDKLCARVCVVAEKPL